MSIAVQDLRCEVSAPLFARRWVGECLRAQLGDALDTAELIDDAVLCASELVTNAVSAGCSTLTVQLTVDSPVVRLAVLDDAPGRPTPRWAGPTERSGRGLRLVEAVSRRWGVDPAASGKEVWAEFAYPLA